MPARRSTADLPTSESMKRGHRVRRFRRGNAEHGRMYLGTKQKPWKHHRPLTVTATAA